MLIALLAVLAGLTSIVMSASESLACSCISQEPRDAVAEADAAFVGTLVERVDHQHSIFRVALDAKGNLDDTIRVQTGALWLCGISAKEGERVGLLLTRDEHRVWTSDACTSLEPNVLIRAVAPLPEPDGVGPARLILGGNFGEARVMSLDAAGRTLAYGFGDGDVYDVDVCPGGERMVESVSHGEVASLAVRDVGTLAVVREVPVVEARFPAVTVVDCIDRAGERLAAIDDKGGFRVHVVEGERLRTVFEGRGAAWWSNLGPGYAEVVLRGGEFGRVDLETGRFDSIVRLPAGGPGARMSPDGRWVAAVGRGGPMLVPVDGGPVVWPPHDSYSHRGRVEWRADGRLIFLPQAEDIDRLAIYDVPSFGEVVGANGWYSTEMAVVDGVTYGVGWNRLVAVELGVDDDARIVRTFDGRLITIASVVGDAPADASSDTINSTVQPLSAWSRAYRILAIAATILVAMGVALRRRSRTAGSSPPDLVQEH